LVLDKNPPPQTPRLPAAEAEPGMAGQKRQGAESGHLCTGGIELAESGRIDSAKRANRGYGKPGQQISGEFNVKRHRRRRSGGRAAVSGDARS